MFGSERIISTASQTSHLFTDTPDLLLMSVTESIISDRNIPNGIVSDLIDSYARKGKRLQQYAKKKYTLGYPSGGLKHVGLNDVAVKNFIQNQINKTIDLDYVITGTSVEEFELLKFLYETRQYNELTNRISKYPRSIQNPYNNYVNTFNQKINTYGNPTKVRNSYRSIVESTNENNETIITIQDAEITSINRNLVQSLNTTILGNIARYVKVRVRNVNKESGWRFGFEDVLDGYTVNYQSDFNVTINVNYDVMVTTTVKRFYVEDDEPKIEETVTTSPASYQESFDFSRSLNSNEYVPINQRSQFNSTELMYAAVYSVNGSKKVRIGNVRVDGLNNQQFIRSNRGFYPLVPIRVNKRNIDTNKNSQSYITSKRMLSRMDINLDTLISELMKNEGVDDVNHSYLTFGIPINTKRESGVKYLYEFFEYCFSRSAFSRSDYEDWMANNVIGIDSTNTPVPVIPNAFGSFSSYSLLRALRGFNKRNFFEINQSGLDYRMGWDFIDIQTHSGSIGKIGTCTSKIFKKESITFRTFRTVWDGDRERRQRIITDTSYIRLRKQVSKNEFREIRVHGLASENLIYRNRGQSFTLGQIGSDDRDLIVPLYDPVINKLGLADRNKVYFVAPLMIFNSYQITKVKWYQSSFFGFVLQVAAIGLFIYTGGASGFLAGLSAAASVGAIAVAKFLIMTAFKSLVINFGLKLATKVLGKEATILLAMAAMYAGWAHSEGKTFAMDLPFAEDFILIGNGLIKAVNDGIVAEMKNITSAAKLLGSEFESKFDELEKINKELDSRWILDPLSFTRYNLLFIEGEEVEDYFNRTVRSNNPAELAIDSVSNYVDIMLQLPKLKDSLREEEEYGTA